MSLCVPPKSQSGEGIKREKLGICVSKLECWVSRYFVQTRGLRDSEAGRSHCLGQHGLGGGPGGKVVTRAGSLAADHNLQCKRSQQFHNSICRGAEPEELMRKKTHRSFRYNNSGVPGRLGSQHRATSKNSETSQWPDNRHLSRPR